MPRKCIYCKGHVEDNSVIDFCETCGIKVWGHKMFKAIKDGMENSRERGDLEQGNVSY